MLPRIRLQRVAAVARMEARAHLTGRPALRLALVAATLLLPASLVPTPRPAFLAPTPTPAEGTRVAVRGSIPPGLERFLVHDEAADVEIRPGPPPRVVALDASPALRAALDQLPGASAFERRDVVRKARLPGRSLLLVALAISLLTGPMAEVLPGERARGTLEVLLTASITRGELVTGKWLAWTLSGSLAALLPALVAVARGLQEPGWWLAALPLVVACFVAVGLWLVRLVDDLAGAASAPLRVLPVVGTVAMGAALLVPTGHPLLAALVPLGGPLLAAAGMLPGIAALVAAAASSAALVALLLAGTARDLDRSATRSPSTLPGTIALAAGGIVAWWLAVAGAAVWSGGPDGNAAALVGSLGHSLAAGSLLLLLGGVLGRATEQPAAGLRVERLRAPEGSHGAPQARSATQHGSATPALHRTEAAATASRMRRPLAVLLLLACAALLAAGGATCPTPSSSAGAVLELALERLHRASLPVAASCSGAAATPVWILVAAALAQAWFFYGMLARRSGPAAAAFAWTLASSPLAPWAALPAALVLAAGAAQGGWIVAGVMHAAWLFAGAGAAPASPMTATVLQASAALVATALLASASATPPSRHQP